MKKFPQISVNFALRGVVGIRGRNIVVALAKSPLAARKAIDGIQHRGSRHFDENFCIQVQDKSFQDQKEVLKSVHEREQTDEKTRQ